MKNQFFGGAGGWARVRSSFSRNKYFQMVYMTLQTLLYDKLLPTGRPKDKNSLRELKGHTPLIFSAFVPSS